MKRRWYFLDRDGWPVVRMKGRPFTNAVRLLLHTRRITRERPQCLDMTTEQRAIEMHAIVDRLTEHANEWPPSDHRNEALSALAAVRRFVDEAFNE